MKKWERPEIGIVALSETEKDLCGEGYDGYVLGIDLGCFGFIPLVPLHGENPDCPKNDPPKNDPPIDELS